MAYTEPRPGILIGPQANMPAANQIPLGVIYIAPAQGTTPTSVYINNTSGWTKLF